MDDRCVIRSLSMDSSNEPSPDRCRWFPGARLNIAHCALNSQRALPSCPAMVWAEQDSPSLLLSMSIEQLRASVAQTAQSVLQLFKPGKHMNFSSCALHHVRAGICMCWQRCILAQEKAAVSTVHATALHDGHTVHLCNAAS